MENWTAVGPLHQLKPNVAKKVVLPSGEPVAVVRLEDDRVVAVSNLCCHKEASLCAGDIEDLVRGRVHGTGKDGSG